MKKAITRSEKKQEEPPGIIDLRIKIAELIAIAPEPGIIAIRELYPEYFLIKAEIGSLEYISEINSSYLKWKEDYGITKEWIEDFPTNEIYYNYKRYCVENHLNGMEKTLFYNTLENDFNFIRSTETTNFISA